MSNVKRLKRQMLRELVRENVELIEGLPRPGESAAVPASASPGASSPWRSCQSRCSAPRA